MGHPHSRTSFSLVRVRMSGKGVCLVVGGGPGIGYSVARRWAGAGHQVVVTRRAAVTQQEMERDCGPGVQARASNEGS